MAERIDTGSLRSTKKCPAPERHLAAALTTEGRDEAPPNRLASATILADRH